ncbi:hypothetical protein [Streptomyces hoynatensis]|uniref:Uncharacterized protein n=1 Tax=Streptomyces hoynatensis TaxID=1141874 RepID=A0A3A9Z905_9ACTN|nr:hypothetical protein [Streptomyces hoynatensis]RKN44753.1 hypothetical protein D7294_06370 [Streptomyces hoynatensis]
MRASKPPRRSEPAAPPSEFAEEREDFEFLDDEFDDEQAGEVIRVVCPGCARPIALARAGDSLPQHALCPTPWDPFGLQVCPGSGRAVAEGGAVETPVVPLVDTAVLAALPEGLDWRLQPFSHVAAPGPAARMPALRQAA